MVSAVSLTLHCFFYADVAPKAVTNSIHRHTNRNETDGWCWWGNTQIYTSVPATGFLLLANKYCNPSNSIYVGSHYRQLSKYNMLPL